MTGGMSWDCLLLYHTPYSIGWYYLLVLRWHIQFRSSSSERHQIVIGKSDVRFFFFCGQYAKKPILTSIQAILHTVLS